MFLLLTLRWRGWALQGWEEGLSHGKQECVTCVHASAVDGSTSWSLRSGRCLTLVGFSLSSANSPRKHLRWEKTDLRDVQVTWGRTSLLPLKNCSWAKVHQETKPVKVPKLRCSTNETETSPRRQHSSQANNTKQFHDQFNGFLEARARNTQGKFRELLGCGRS